VRATAVRAVLDQTGGDGLGLLGGDRAVVDERLQHVAEPGAHLVGGGGGRHSEVRLVDLLHDGRRLHRDVAGSGAGQTGYPEHETGSRPTDHPEREPGGDRTVHARASGRVAGVVIAVHDLHPLDGESSTNPSVTAPTLSAPGEECEGVT